MHGVHLPREPTTEKGRQSRELLLKQAARAFTRHGFHGTSVAHILRESGMAGGSFYQYFKDKEAVFQALVSRAREGFIAALGDERTPEGVCGRMFDFYERYGDEFQAFREAEFLGGEEPRRLFYEAAIGRMRELLGIDEPTAWALFGAQSMVAVRYGIWPHKRIPARIRADFLGLVKDGIAPGPTERWRDVTLPLRWTDSPEPEPESKGGRTQRRIVTAARELFFRDGYVRTHISHVTQKAGVALGTFYVHFGSKRELLARLVEDYRRRLLGGAIQVTVDVTDRLERERRAAIYFLHFLRVCPDIYRVVREAEFAEPSIGRGHYLWIAQQNTARLNEAMQRGQLRRTDPGLVAWFLMGILLHAGARWVLWDESATPASAIRQTLRFEMNGLRG